jgi:hypothetical protein
MKPYQTSKRGKAPNPKGKGRTNKRGPKAAPEKAPKSTNPQPGGQVELTPQRKLRAKFVYTNSNIFTVAQTATT